MNREQEKQGLVSALIRFFEKTGQEYDKKKVKLGLEAKTLNELRALALKWL